MTSFYSNLVTFIDSAKKADVKSIFVSDKICPKCNVNLLKKKSDYGIFYGCQNWPDCNYILKLNENGKEEEAKAETGEKCPTCSNGILIERKGKFGKFKGCSAYPTCNHIEKIGKDGKAIVKEKPEDSQYDCPKCKEKLLKRNSKYGEWHACRNYPKCKYSYSPSKKNANKEV